MASIKKRGTTYLIRISLGRDAEGKRIYNSFTYKPKATRQSDIEKEVQRVALEREERLKAGRYLEGETMSFADFSEYWKRDWASRNLTQRVYEDYCGILNRDVLPVVGRLKLAEIKPLHIQNYINQLDEDGKAPKTIRHYYGVLNSVMKYAFRMEMIDSNPCTRCVLPKLKQDSSLHFFNQEQAKQFLNVALDMKYTVSYKDRCRTANDGTIYMVNGYNSSHAIPFQFKVFFTLALYGGFRRGELIALTWNDIDEEECVININKAASKTKGGQIIKEPKTPSAVRSVNVPSLCIEQLKEWKKEQRQLSLVLGTKWEGHRGKNFDKNHIFITNTGRMMDVDTPTHKFKEILELYNSCCEREEDKLPMIRLHDLRHTTATLLLASGVDIETVSHRLGHSKASITMDVYGHAIPEIDKTAAQMLGNMLA